MTSGDLTLFEPGESVTVTLVADSGGNVAGLNDLVEITGENSSHTEVSVVETRGAGVAMLKSHPPDYDDTATYAAGEVVGEASVVLRHAVDWLNPTTVGALAAGDLVVSDAGGTVDAYDTDGTAPDDDPADLVGPVFRTGGYGDHVAVVRHR